MTFHSDEGPPCAHMETLLQEVADGSARGLKKWYAVAHAAQCSHCGTFLGRLKVTLKTLRESKTRATDSEAVQRLKARLAELEKGAA